MNETKWTNERSKNTKNWSRNGWKIIKYDLWAQPLPQYFRKSESIYFECMFDAVKVKAFISSHSSHTHTQLHHHSQLYQMQWMNEWSKSYPTIWWTFYVMLSLCDWRWRYQMAITLYIYMPTYVCIRLDETTLLSIVEHRSPWTFGKTWVSVWILEQWKWRNINQMNHFTRL